MRTVFLGSPPFATPILERLIASRHRPALVVTPPDRRRGRGRRLERSEVAALAERHGIEVLQPDTVRDEAVLARLRSAEADVFAVASYGEYLPRRFTEIPARECLNVHPSLLPRHRGATPVQAAILAGDRVTGVSIQRVAEKLDAGDVVTALETEARAGETAGELAERLAELGAEALARALDAIEEGTAVFRPQDESAATTCTKLGKEDGVLDWRAGAAELARRVRAMNPWPAARTKLPSGAELTVLRARPLEGGEPSVPPGTPPGALLEVAGRLVVATGAGALELALVKPAGKSAMSGADFGRGARLEPGEVLGEGARA